MIGFSCFPVNFLEGLDLIYDILMLLSIKQQTDKAATMPDIWSVTQPELKGKLILHLSVKHKFI